MSLRQLLIIAFIVCLPYAWNGYKLVQCDFEADYTCEVVHGIGTIIPPAAYITVWFSSDKK